ncbi:hypothetical protein JCM10213_006082 [Rhodosporidiobolus nylandii]
MGIFLPFSLIPTADDDPLSSLSQPKRPDQANPLPTLVAVVVESILEVFFLCLVGWILAKKGIVDDKAKKTLNKINTSLFTPCLLFNKVAFSLTPDKLAELYIIPIGFCLVSLFSAGVAWGFGSLVGLKRGQRNFAIACATFQNSNSLPIALLQSLIGEKLPLAWGPHDTKDAMLGRGLSYLVLFSSLGIIVRWSIGVRLLTSAENDQEDDVPPADAGESGPSSVTAVGDTASSSDATARDEDYEGREDAQPAGETDGLLHLHHKASSGSILKKPGQSSSAGGGENGSGSGNGSKLVVLPPDDAENDAPLPSSGDAAAPAPRSAAEQRRIRKQRARIFQSFPNTPAASLYSSSRAPSEAGDYDEDEESEGSDVEDDEEWGMERGAGRRFLPTNSVVRKTGRWAKRVGKAGWKRVRRVARKINEFLTVPLWAALLSLFVACVPPLQRVLNEAEPLKAAIRSAGSCSVPITLVTLGAYFYRPSSSTASASTTSPLRPADDEYESPAAPASFSSTLLRRLRSPFAPLPRPSASAFRNGRGETRTVVVAVVSRMIIVPLVLIPLFAWYAKVTVNVADDPVFVVVACLLIGSPAAITLATITSATATPTFEKLISRVLFVSYAVLTAPTTIALVLAALYIDKLQHPAQALVDAAMSTFSSSAPSVGVPAMESLVIQG